MRINYIKSFSKMLVPPFFWNLCRNLSISFNGNRHITFHHGFKTWEEASKEISDSYADHAILEAIRSAAARVRSGEFPYERDGVLFKRVEVNWRLISIIYIHLREVKPEILSVLDFGGGLGTTYYQFVNSIKHNNLKINWVVVEQENFVKVGRDEFTSFELSFAYDVQSCKFEGKFIALALGVLQYLENPYTHLSQILAMGPEYFFVDATPFSKDGLESFAVQVVPSSIYSASYVARIFCWDDFLRVVENDYQLVLDWECTEQPDPQNIYRGAIFRKNI